MFCHFALFTETLSDCTLCKLSHLSEDEMFSLSSGLYDIRYSLLTHPLATGCLCQELVTSGGTQVIENAALGPLLKAGSSFLIAGLLQQVARFKRPRGRDAFT